MGRLFDIGFLPVRIWDILDVLIVGYLIYQLYKLLRGSIAFNIFIGLIFIFVVWWLVGLLEMTLLTSILGKFASVGVLMLLIVFQPEVRRFLLLLGNSTLRRRSTFFRRLMDRNLNTDMAKEEWVDAIMKAVLRMSRQKTGALIVLARSPSLDFAGDSGTRIDANISQQLIESVFNKYSPLHDGAMVIFGGKILAASCVLPVSANPELPPSAGLRHRAAVGVTENSNLGVLVVSEETGAISFAHSGKLEKGLTDNKIRKRINTFLR